MADSDKKQSMENLKGKLLLAMPGMGDPRFEKAVIFVCAHDENGAIGLVVNNAMDNIRFSSVIEEFGMTSDIEVDLVNASVPVLSGGPVERARGFLLHSSDFCQRDTVKINESFGVTGTLDGLKEVASGNGPEKALFILGYAGWGEGQLEGELKDNAWLVVDAAFNVVFDVENDTKWEAAVATLGIDPALLSADAGHA